jgi:hypothetical protein
MKSGFIAKHRSIWSGLRASMSGSSDRPDPRRVWKAFWRTASNAACTGSSGGCACSPCGRGHGGCRKTKAIRYVANVLSNLLDRQVAAGRAEIHGDFDAGSGAQSWLRLVFLVKSWPKALFADVGIMAIA